MEGAAVFFAPCFVQVEEGSADPCIGAAPSIVARVPVCTVALRAGPKPAEHGVRAARDDQPALCRQESAQAVEGFAQLPAQRVQRRPCVRASR